MNIYDKTEDLAASIKASGEYEDFLRCKKKISSDPRAVAMFREYRQYQIALEFAKMSGEGVDELNSALKISAFAWKKILLWENILRQNTILPG